MTMGKHSRSGKKKRKSKDKNKVQSSELLASTGAPVSQESQDEQVQNMAVKSLFKYVKFINSEAELDDMTSGNSMAKFCAKKMNIEQDKEQKWYTWWNDIKQLVKQRIAQSRTDANSHMKRKYKGTRLV